MRGARKLSKPNPMGRRFKDSRDDKARERVKAMRCLIAGRRGTLIHWRGLPKVEVKDEYIHVCQGPVDPHHPKTKARGGHDRETVPLCRAAHDQLGYMGAKKFAALWGIDVSAVERR